MKSSQKSRATVPQRLQGGKKSWQKISVVSLERICKWEEGERGEVGREGLRKELGLKRKRDAWTRVKGGRGKSLDE